VTFPFNVYLLALLGAGLTTCFALPLWRRWCVRHGLVDDPGYRKIHDKPIPLAGGLAVMTGMLIPTFIASLALWWQSAHGTLQPESPATYLLGAPASRQAADGKGATDLAPLNRNIESVLLYGLNRRAAELGGIFLGALGMLAVGWLDDKRELRPGPKFAGQLLIAALVAASGARITLFVHSALFQYAITILWILTVINAFNFMDNMNGLCAGLGAIGAWCFAALAAADGQYLVALIALLTFGSLLGFLPYNFPRARAFLGDSGSHLVGYLLAVLAILPHFYTTHHPRRWAVLIPLLVLAVPLGDMVWVVLLRWRLGQPFYVGDNNHLSHRLVRRGLSRTQAVLWIWLAAAVAGAAAAFL
jgi:UDP-GlcNAc:undecaprenyl-phosphate GlcNAc-1-phosphate transferase